MPDVIRGIVKGNLVILEEGVQLAEGVTVEIRVVPKTSKATWEPFIGLWADHPEWDDIVAEISRARTLKPEPPTL